MNEVTSGSGFKGVGLAGLDERILLHFYGKKSLDEISNEDLDATRILKCKEKVRQ